MYGHGCSVPTSRRPRWLFLLCAWLLAWVPLNFATLASRSLPSVGSRGGAAGIELAAHAAAAALCVAAGWMLWVRHAAGIGLAAAALIVNAAVTIQGLYVSALPRDVSPGLALPLALITVAYSAGWLLYLKRSQRLRVWVGAA